MILKRLGDPKAEAILKQAQQKTADLIKEYEIQGLDVTKFKIIEGAIKDILDPEESNKANKAVLAATGPRAQEIANLEAYKGQMQASTVEAQAKGEREALQQAKQTTKEGGGYH